MESAWAGVPMVEVLFYLSKSLKKAGFPRLFFYSTVTDLAKLRGLSTSVPLASAV